MIGALLVVAQLSIVAHGPDTASTCEAVEVSVAVSAPGRAVPQVVVPSLAPFDVLRASAIPHVTFDGGSVIAEYRYVLTTDRTGTFIIPPFEARSGAAVARSRPIALTVRNDGTTRLPTVVARARVDTSLEINFRALTQPETVFVGQQANYEVAVFLNETVRDRLRRNPTFFPPDMQSMLAYDLPTRADPPRRQVGSHCYDALVYQRALFPLMPGRFAIPPAQLVYSLPLSASFFSREETHELQTDSTVVVAVEPPTSGRPADFGGAVGRLRLSTQMDTTGSRVGDPLLLTVRVSGTGNVKLFPRPDVGIPWASLVRGDERVQVDTTARKIAGTKEFDWVLTPRIAGELDLPPIHYSYFNPDTRRYEVASTTSRHLRVGAGTLASADTARDERALLPLRTRYRGAPRAPLHEHPAFWVVLALVPIPALSLGTRERRRRVAALVPDHAARLATLARVGAGATTASDVRRAFNSALADRLGLTAESFTRTGALARSLRRRGVSTDVAMRAEQYLRELDEAAFAQTGTLSRDAAARGVALFRAVDAEALPRIQIRPVGVTVIALLAATVATAHAFDAANARQAFDAGVAAYEQHDFVSARRAFGAAVTADPRSPDAWADLGTAAWAVADSAHAVAAWQHALRLEPLATDVRERVELVHTLPWTAAGYVPPLPAPWVFDIAAVLWCVAWGAAAYRSARQLPSARREVATLAVVAALAAVGGFALVDRLSGRHLAVLRRTASLSEDPLLGGDRGATGIIGEVVHVTGRQGAWSRVVLDDGRDGWLQNAMLISLDTRDARDVTESARAE